MMKPYFIETNKLLDELYLKHPAYHEEFRISSWQGRCISLIDLTSASLHFLMTCPFLFTIELITQIYNVAKTLYAIATSLWKSIQTKEIKDLKEKEIKLLDDIAVLLLIPIKFCFVIVKPILGIIHPGLVLRPPTQQEWEEHVIELIKKGKVFKRHGKSLIAADLFNEAIQLTREALKTNPDNELARKLLAKAFAVQVIRP